MLSFSFQIYFQRQETQNKTQKKQQIVLRMKLRKDRFRMFGPHSKPISIVLALFKADFGHWPIWSDSTDTISFCKLARIKAESAWICKKKKKKLRCSTWRVGSHVGGRTPRQAVSNSGAAPSQPHQCFLSLKFWRSFIVFAWFLHYMMFCVVNLSLMFFL